jgi:hypothetical protein
MVIDLKGIIVPKLISTESNKFQAYSTQILSEKDESYVVN